MDIKEINLKVANLIKNEITEVTYKTWCKYVEYAYIEENNIIIPVTNEFEKGIIEDRYLSLFNTAYSFFKNEFNYDEIIILVKEKIIYNQNNNEINSIESYKATNFRAIADKKNTTPINVEKVVEEELKDYTT